MNPSHNHRDIDKQDKEMNLDKDLLSFEAELRTLQPSAVRFELESVHTQSTSQVNLVATNVRGSQWPFVYGCVAGMAAGVAATLLATNLFTTPVGPILPDDGPALAVTQPSSSSSESPKPSELPKGTSSSDLERLTARDTDTDSLATTRRSWTWLNLLSMSRPSKTNADGDPNRFHIVRAKLDPHSLSDVDWLNEWIEPWASKTLTSVRRDDESSRKEPVDDPLDAATRMQSTETLERNSQSPRTPSSTLESPTPNVRPGQHELMRRWLNESERFSG